MAIGEPDRMFVRIPCAILGSMGYLVEEAIPPSRHCHLTHVAIWYLQVAVREYGARINFMDIGLTRRSRFL